MSAPGTVVDGFFNGERNQFSFGCHHKRRSKSVLACGGCYARLSLAIDEAIEAIEEGRPIDAARILEATHIQRLNESPAMTNAPKAEGKQS